MMFAFCPVSQKAQSQFSSYSVHCLKISFLWSSFSTCVHVLLLCCLYFHCKATTNPCGPCLGRSLIPERMNVSKMHALLRARHCNGIASMMATFNWWKKEVPSTCGNSLKSSCSRVTWLAHVPFHACCVFTHLEGAPDGNESCLAKALLEHLGLWLYFK